MRKKLIPLVILLLLLIYIVYSQQKRESFNPYEVKYLIGVSQCNLGEPWRIKMNEDIANEAAKHEGLKVIFTDAAQNNEKQIEDVKTLMELGVDLLIVSPNEAQPLTQVVAEAYKEIPVIVLDRSVNSDDYTLFIGADNYEIGYKAGELAKELCNKDEVNILEIQGLPGSPPAVMRSQGFHDAIAKDSRLKVVDSLLADWLRDLSETATLQYLEDNPKKVIDLVYAHNDPMAFGAYKASKALGYEGIKFIGIDGLKGEEGGLNLVSQDILECTFIYPTGGKEAVTYALDILQGIEFDEKNITLDSKVVRK